MKFQKIINGQKTDIILELSQESFSNLQKQQNQSNKRQLLAIEQEKDKAVLDMKKIINLENNLRIITFEVIEDEAVKKGK